MVTARKWSDKWSAGSPPAGDGRRDRNRRIRELRDQGWSLAAIAAEVGLSDEGVRKILGASIDPEERLRDEERAIETELRHLDEAVRGHRSRIRRLRRRLRIVEEELESRSIDRLLDLGN